MPADIRQVVRLSADVRQLVPEARGRARVAVQAACARTKAYGQINAPKDTGFLASSVGYETKNLRDTVVGSVGPTADYGLFVELGTSHMTGQPYMGPAADRVTPDFYRALDGIAELGTGPRIPRGVIG